MREQVTLTSDEILRGRVLVLEATNAFLSDELSKQVALVTKMSARVAELEAETEDPEA